MRNIKEKRGITLIALVVTIIVILILAGVTIDAVFSENGIINKAKEAANAMNNAVANDQENLNALFNELNNVFNGNGSTDIVSIKFGEIIWNNNKAEVTISTDTEYTIQYQINSKDGEWKEIENNGKIIDLSYTDIIYARLKNDRLLDKIAEKTIDDTVAPKVTVKVETKTDKSINVKVDAIDEESGLADTETYTYLLGDERKGVDINNIYAYTELTAGTKYIIKVNVKDKAGNIGTGELETMSMVAEPSGWTLIGSYDTSQNFQIPEDGWFKFELVGKSGNGGSAYGSAQTGQLPSASAGGSGRIRRIMYNNYNNVKK